MTKPHHLRQTGLLLVGLAGICLWGLYAWKAGSASITHDEAGTYFNGVMRDFSLWSCHWNPLCWGDANNHILNTQMIRWSTSVFGVSEITLRLPNLMTFLLFLAVCGAMSLRLARTSIGALCTFCIFTLNPYNLEFFALARGYGMALGWMMVSIYCVWRHAQHETPHPGWIAAAFATAALSVSSNLTFSAYYIALGGLLTVYTLSQVRQRLKTIALACLGPLLISLALVWYFDTPVAILSERGEFHYGVTSMWASWFDYVRNSLYGANYLGKSTVTITAWVILAALGLAAAGVLRREPTHATGRFGRSVVILTAMLLIFLFANHWIMDANLPSGRKSLIYGPLASAMFVMGIYTMRSNQLRSAVLYILALALVFHMFRTWNTNSFREWWYDADTRNMVEYVAQSSSGCDIDVAMEWLFYPAAHFYSAVMYPEVTLAPYSREIDPAVDACFYYVHPEHKPVLEEAFDEEKNFNGRLLFRRKD